MKGLYDLHTHTILSDGEMLPIELIRRMAVTGYTTVAITDHVDASNTQSVVSTLIKIRESADLFGVKLLCGVEITHVPPSEIAVLHGWQKPKGRISSWSMGKLLLNQLLPDKPLCLLLRRCERPRPPRANNSGKAHSQYRTMLHLNSPHAGGTNGPMVTWHVSHARLDARS